MTREHVIIIRIEFVELYAAIKLSTIEYTL